MDEPHVPRSTDGSIFAEACLTQGDVYYLGPDELLNVFYALDTREGASHCLYGTDLPAPLQVIHDVLTTAAAGFAISSDTSLC